MLSKGSWTMRRDSQAEIASTRRRTFLSCILVIHTLLRIAYPCDGKTPDAGFSLPENIQEATFNYSTYNNLIVLPVTINGSIKVNLILDTGCRNLLLFGKKFEKLFETLPNHPVTFSGLGERPPLTGKLSLDNEVAIHSLLGKKIPIVILPNKNFFMSRPNIDGIIGYDIFIRFEVELNALKKQIKFRPADQARTPNDYTIVPLTIEDTRPLIQSKIFLSDRDGTDYEVMIDTGSVLGLLLRSRDEAFFDEQPQHVLGRGLNGNVRGIVKWARKLILETFEINIAHVEVSRSDWHSHGTIGMAIIKDYNIVLNYCKGYAGFKKSRAHKLLI
jgi:hypothetical protein